MAGIASLPGLVVGLESVEHERWQETEIAKIQQQMAMQQFLEQQALDQQRRDTEIKAKRAEGMWGQAPTSVQPPPGPMPQVPAPGQSSPAMMSAFGPQSGPPAALQPPQGGAPQLPPGVAPGPVMPPWQRAPGTPTGLGGRPAGPGPSGPDQVTPMPTPQPPTPPPAAFKSANELGQWGAKQVMAGKMKWDEVADMVEGAIPIYDQQNRAMVDGIREQHYVEQEKERRAEDARREWRDKHPKPDAELSRALFAAGSKDPSLPVDQQDPAVVAKARKIVGAEEARKGRAGSAGGVGTGKEQLTPGGRAVLAEMGRKGLSVPGSRRADIQIATVNQIAKQLEDEGKPYTEISQERINFNAEKSVQKDFTSGPTSRNITSINTALGHMQTLRDAGRALGNNDLQIANRLLNTIRKELGQPEIPPVNLTSQAVGEELMRTFRVVGASVTEAREWEEKVAPMAQSPKQMDAAVKTMADLLRSRLEALDDQWRRGMDTDKGFPDIISDKNQKFLSDIGVKYRVTPGKRSSGEAGGGIEAAVRAAGEDYEPDKYEYRIQNGKVQKRLKSGG